MRYYISLMLVVLLAVVLTTTLQADEPGSVIVWGVNNEKLLNVPTPNRDFVAISAGNDHCLALKADGSIVAWGNNNRSIFNTYGTGKCDVPLQNTGFVAIAAGGDHSLGLKADGSIVKWGFGIWGEDEILAEHTDFVAISAYNHCLGLKADSSIVTWGSLLPMFWLGLILDLRRWLPVVAIVMLCGPTVQLRYGEPLIGTVCVISPNPIPVSWRSHLVLNTVWA